MKTTELNSLKNTLDATISEENKVEVEPGKFLDLLKDVEDEKLVPLTDDNDNIIGINGHNVPTGVKCSKLVNGHMTMGKDEDERKRDQEDLEAMIEKYTPLFMTLGGPNRAFEACLKLKAAGIKPAKVVMNGEGLFFIVPELQRVIDEDGETVVTCDVAKSTAQCVIVELLEARLQANRGCTREV